MIYAFLSHSFVAGLFYIYKKRSMPRSDKKPAVLLEEKIINKIFLVRAEKVMLDRDLAECMELKPSGLKKQCEGILPDFHLIL